MTYGGASYRPPPWEVAQFVKQSSKEAPSPATFEGLSSSPDLMETKLDQLVNLSREV